MDVTIPGQIREHNTALDAHKGVFDGVKQSVSQNTEDIGKLRMDLFVETSKRNGAIAEHNASREAHADIRELISFEAERRSAAIIAERERALAAEAGVSGAVTAEANRAKDEEAKLSGSISAEAARATAAESALDGRITQNNDALSQLEHRVEVLERIEKQTLTLADIDVITAHNLNHRFFATGDQIETTWKTSNTVYANPFDVLEPMREFELEDGAVHTGLPIQAHWASCNAPVYDAQEALYDIDDTLPAGTYHFKVVNHPWLTAENNHFYQFTTAQDFPAGYQISFSNQDAYGVALAGQTVKVYPSADNLTAVAEYTLSEGQGGTLLGQTDGKGAVNDLYSAYCGNGRWATSAVRQFLNSDKPVGQWWTKQSRFDRITAYANSTPGYMYGLPEDFKSVLKKVKVKTARNTRFYDGGTDETFDYFFLLSLQEQNGIPQIADIEGAAYDYWIKRAAADGVELDAQGRYKNHPSLYETLKKYGINANTSARSCWLRSACRGTATAWYVSNTGYINATGALGGNYVAPACVI